MIQFLTGVLHKKYTYDQHFDIYGPNTLTYKQMLMHFAKIRKLKRKVKVVPLFTPRLSSFWLYLVTSTSYPLAKNLIDSMKVDVIAKENELSKRLHIVLVPYDEAIQMAFEKIEQNMVLSSWNDAGDNRIFKKGLATHIEIPKFGVFKNDQTQETKEPEKALERIFAIGGRNGWYYANWLWGFRGFLDRLFGGAGLRRGRKNVSEVSPGDTLNFWRVIYANKEEKRLLLYAEMN